MSCEEDKAPAASFYGGRDQYRTLLNIQSDAERIYGEKLVIGNPSNPYSQKPNCCNRYASSCVKRYAPAAIQKITYNDIMSLLGPVIVISISFFLVFILAWLPMAIENNRPCSLIAPDTVFGNSQESFFEEDDIEISQYILGFDRDGVIRRTTSYDAYLYTKDMSNILARYKGNTNRMVYIDSDPQCIDESLISINSSVHFCFNLRSPDLPGAPWNQRGEPLILDITSPQLDNFLISFSVRLRPHKMVFPNIEIKFENVSGFPNIEQGSKLVFTSSKNSVPYIRRTFFERGRLELRQGKDFVAIEEDILWPGAATGILSVGNYKEKFGINDIPNGVKQDGKFHRLCVPSLEDEDDLDRIDFDNESDAIELFEKVLFSKDVSGKLMFHMRATSLYRDFTGNNRALKVSLGVIVFVIVINSVLIFLERNS